jgi:peptidoglycan/LPS O-acetylase OafA/YrhL
LLVVETFQAIGSSFAMALFLFISAYLLVGSFDRKGQKKFLQDRFVRIGIPLFGMVAFLLILTAAVGAHPVISSFSWLFLIAAPGANSATFSLGWLWFLALLLILAVVYSVWRTLHITIPPVPCPGNGTLVLAAVALAAANYVVRRWYGLDQWVLWHAVEPAHVLLYVLFIVGGILAYRNAWLETVSSSLVWTWGIVSVVGLCVIPVLIASPPPKFDSLLYAFWEAFLGIGICVTLLIVCKHRWNTTGRIKAALAKNVYAVYIIQIPIIVFLQSRFIQGGILIPGGLPPLLQFVLVGALATALCFLISNYVVRKIPYAERVLF